MNAWEAAAGESGIKLIDFLKSKLGAAHSARTLKRLIESNQCQINGRTERFASTLIGRGDKITLNLTHLKSSASKLPQIDASHILYEDQDLLIYDKPAGIPSDDPSFHQALQRFAPQLELIHRLDKETSGLLMFAKHAKMREAMIEEFRGKKVKKTYLAIVDGAISKTAGVIDNYLGKIGAYQGQSLWGSVPCAKGLHARTEWALLKKGKEASILHCFPITGRTHQIRVHLSSIKHPILGDYQYGKTFKCFYQPNRCLLHALEVSFIHPIKNELVTANAAVPEDMISAIQTLGMDF